MGSITFDRRTINESLQNKYVLPTYQREYKWTDKQFRELLTDLQDAFRQNYKEEHGRKDVGSYNEYFMGTIITTESSDGQKSIIDGQQRLTTITLILTYLQRRKITNCNLQITDMDNLIRRELYGEKDYNLSFDDTRTKLFNLILDPACDDDKLIEGVDSIGSLDNSSKSLFDLFNKIEDCLDTDISRNLLAFFADYIVNKVMLFEIGVPGEQDAHRVFVTMNDRGLKLGPIDLLKGYLLSNIFDNEANTESHRHWMDTMNSLKNLAKEEDSQFLKTWLRSRYATSSRGKSRGDAPGDFEIIGDSYHRWVVDNKNLIGLSNSDDFQTFISEDIPKYSKIYLKIKFAETNSNDSMKHVYYNGVRNLTLQSMLIMSAIRRDDSESTVTKKIKLVSVFLDIFATSRILNGQDNTYDNVRDTLFLLAKSLRDKDFEQLKALLLKESESYLPHINLVKDVTYSSIKKLELLNLLARIAAYIEDVCSQTNSVGFSGYVDRNRANRTFDIEHILSDNPAANKDNLVENGAWDFESDIDYKNLRNSIGGLILLPRGRNRSLKDKPYNEKIQVYGTENILCQSLNDVFLQNNPTAREPLNLHGIDLKSYPSFNRSSIIERAELYKNIASLIWSKESLLAI